jgi:hypothetical protein
VSPDIGDRQDVHIIGPLRARFESHSGSALLAIGYHSDVALGLLPADWDECTPGLVGLSQRHRLTLQQLDVTCYHEQARHGLIALADAAVLRFGTPQLERLLRQRQLLLAPARIERD